MAKVKFFSSFIFLFFIGDSNDFNITNKNSHFFTGGETVMFLVLECFSLSEHYLEVRRRYKKAVRELRLWNGVGTTTVEEFSNTSLQREKRLIEEVQRNLAKLNESITKPVPESIFEM